MATKVRISHLNDFKSLVKFREKRTDYAFYKIEYLLYRRDRMFFFFNKLLSVEN